MEFARVSFSLCQQERFSLRCGEKKTYFEVRVGVEANPVASGSNCRVRAIDPSSPGVDVTNGHTGEGGIGNGSLDLINVVDNGVG